MSHKVHPKAFRIKENSDWNSRWQTKKDFSKYLEEDFKIRAFLTKKLSKAGIEKVEIERSPSKVNVIISSSRPGLIIGRGGAGIEELKKAIEKAIKRYRDKDQTALRLEIKEVKDIFASATLVSQSIAQQLEKRMPFRKVMKQTLEKIMSTKGVEGCKIEVAGRLNGADIARTESLRAGRLPRQTIRADIDYALSEARTTFGAIGVKVWVYKGEKFNK